MITKAREIGNLDLVWLFWKKARFTLLMFVCCNTAFKYRLIPYKITQSTKDLCMYLSFRCLNEIEGLNFNTDGLFIHFSLPFSIHHLFQ